MGRAVANATNAAQGWRKPAAQAANPQPQPEPITMMQSSDKAMSSGRCCYPTGNKYRAKHDDGTRMSRSKSGGGSMKHRSSHTKGGGY
ncbi:MAG: hypothetical protein ACR2PR_07150 [Pseudohongiellaceae bacterium]